MLPKKDCPKCTDASGQSLIIREISIAMPHRDSAENVVLAECCLKAPLKENPGDGGSWERRR